MPSPLTPAQLRAAAVAARGEANRLRLLAAAQDAHAAFLDDAATNGLTILGEGAIVRHKMQPNLAAPPRKVGRPISSGHAFPKALARANVTMVEYAAKLRKNRSTVKSWLDRPIPRAMAEFIEADLGVPASLKSWPAGIK